MVRKLKSFIKKLTRNKSRYEDTLLQLTIGIALLAYAALVLYLSYLGYEFPDISYL